MYYWISGPAGALHAERKTRNLVALYEQYKDKGFTVYSVSLDDNRDAWMQAIRSDKLNWPSHVSQLQNGIPVQRLHTM